MNHPRWRRIGLVGVASGAGLLTVYWRLVRPWTMRWGATTTEAAQPLPGDQLMTRPGFSATRAITIAARPEYIWPWLVQLGSGRAGWYAIDRIDNAGVPSAQTIRPELHCEAAHPARGADDHDRLAWLDPSGVTERLEGGEPGDGHGRGLLEAEVRRLQRQLVLGHRGVLGKGPVAPAKHRITRSQLRHVGADRLNAPGYVEAWNRVLRVGQPVPQTGDVRQASHRQPVALTDGSCVNPDQHRIVADDRLVDVFKFEDIRCAVPGVDDRLHSDSPEPSQVGGEELSGGSVLAAPKPRP